MHIDATPARHHCCDSLLLLRSTSSHSCTQKVMARRIVEQLHACPCLRFRRPTLVALGVPCEVVLVAVRAAPVPRPHVVVAAVPTSRGSLKAIPALLHEEA